MVGKSKASDNLDWLLDDLVGLVVGADHAIVLSLDGLLLGNSRSMSPEDAEHLAALASAFQSLARGTGRHFDGGEVRQTVVEMERSYLFVTSAGAGACLAVLAAEEADVGLVAYEMNLRVKQVGQFLTAAPRQSGHLTPAGGGARV